MPSQIRVKKSGKCSVYKKSIRFKNQRFNSLLKIKIMNPQYNIGRDHASKFLKGVWSNPNKKVARYLMLQLAQGHWDAIVKLAADLKYPATLTVKDLKAVIDPMKKLTDAFIFRNRLAADDKLRSQFKGVLKKRKLRKNMGRRVQPRFKVIQKFAKKEGLELTIGEFRATKVRGRAR